MTRSKIQRIKVFVFLLIFLLSQIAACDGGLREKRPVDGSSASSKDENAGQPADKAAPAVNPAPKEPPKEVPALTTATNNTLDGSKKTANNVTSKDTQGPASAPLPTTSSKTISGEHISSMNSGALTRGFFVVVGLSMIFMAYMVFRSFRLSKNRAQMVRKYGVLAHRQDVEMRPLPLDEDDDDDTTVFDASTIPSHRLQSQDS